jgi:hypothetical protein
LDRLRAWYATCREPFGSCQRRRGRRGRASPSCRAGSRRRRQMRSSLFSPAVPPACHKRRSRAVSGGQPRSPRLGDCAGRPLLTWAAYRPRNCMACKWSWSGSDGEVLIVRLAATPAPTALVGWVAWSEVVADAIERYGLNSTPPPRCRSRLRASRRPPRADPGPYRTCPGNAEVRLGSGPGQGW